MAAIAAIDPDAGSKNTRQLENVSLLFDLESGGILGSDQELPAY
jgi:hypothetical protein